MEYLLMTVAIAFATLNSAILKKFNNRTIKNTGDCFFFNGGVSIVWTAVMLIWFFAAGGRSISGGAVLFGLVYGFILCAFLFLKMQSLAEGPVTFTTLIGSAAFIPATVFGIFYASENVSALQIAGIALMLLSVFMCVNPKKSNVSMTLKWIIYCSAFFIAGGVIGVFYKVFGRSDFSSEVNGMMLCASFFSAIFFFCTGIIINKVKNEPMPTLKKASLLWLVTSALAGCVYIRINLSLSAVIPSAIFFPVSNGALVILSTFIGWLVFGEKLNRLQLLGIFVGLISIVLTGIG